MGKEKQFATFYLGDLWFGIEVERIQEVLRCQHITPVPLAPPAVLGLINLRGQIITAIDLRCRLGLSGSSSSLLSSNIVVRCNEDITSFLVDELGEVVEVGEDTFETPPEMLDPISRVLIPGVHKLKDRLMHVLDTEQAMSLETPEFGD
jgi:purine-binding chemotaxis protein CheW